MAPSLIPMLRGPRAISYRLGSLVLMGVLVVVGVLYLVVGQGYETGRPFGPAAFPTLLAIMLIASCLIGIVIAVRQDDQQVALGDLLRVVTVGFVTAAYLIVWALTGWFYPATFVFLAGLMTYLRGTPPRTRSVAVDVLVSAVTTAAVFGFFDMLLGVRF